MILNEKKKYLLSVVIFFSYLSFIIGFLLNENSAGAGSYNGDITWIWRNYDIYKNNNLFEAIHHPDFFGNRTPLIYILHILFNPFIDDYENYRVSVFSISLLGPVTLYFCLKQKFKDIDKKLLILISSIILLSPYYRTSAYWGLDENYGIISMLLSFLFLNYFLENLRRDSFISYFYLFLTILFSSACIYFDQKFLLIPAICLLKIMASKMNIKFILFTLFNYFILSLPFIYLIISWKGIVPPSTQEANPNSITSLSRFNNLYFGHIGYATTIIAFYLLPLLFFKSNNIYLLIKKFFSDKKNYYSISLFFIYLFYLIFLFDFREFTVEKYWIGLGYIHKISIILFENYLLQEIFTYFSFFISWIIILIFIEKNIKNFLIVFYFYFLAILLWPLMQEYFDPFIIVLGLIAFSTTLLINYKNSIFLILYLAFFLISTNIYYFIKLS